LHQLRCIHHYGGCDRSHVLELPGKHGMVTAAVCTTTVIELSQTRLPIYSRSTWALAARDTRNESKPRASARFRSGRSIYRAESCRTCQHPDGGGPAPRRRLGPPLACIVHIFECLLVLFN
jgi:hypothetical protein